MANYKVPRVVELVDDLPRNATGKVVKDALRRRRSPDRSGPSRVSGPGSHGLSSLAGLRVVELGVWVAAPSAAALLADWGAEVIKIESPSGDPDAQRVRVARHRRRPPQPGLRPRQPGQAQPRLSTCAIRKSASDSRSSWTPPTSSSAISGPTPSTSSISKRRRRSAGTPVSSTAASAATASGARSATARPTTSAPSGPGPACRDRWPTTPGTR